MPHGSISDTIDTDASDEMLQTMEGHCLELQPHLVPPASPALGTSRSSTPASSVSESCGMETPATSIMSERDVFLKDITNYQPVGVLRLDLTCSLLPVAHGYGNAWKETTIVTEALPLDHPCVEPLSKLVRASWGRIFCRLNVHANEWGVLRLYILPDDHGRRFLDRNDKGLRSRLKQVMRYVNVSPSAWNGKFDLQSPKDHLRLETGEDSSLFYIFNTLRSPAPEPTALHDKYARKAMEKLLEVDKRVDGLTTTLYPHQRRSAAMMLQKEVEPALFLDPRLQEINGPEGSVYYYDHEAATVLRDRRQYEGPRGGILAETMGLGKTLICLALICATRDQWPEVPAEYSEGALPCRSSVASLLDMSAAATTRHSIPFRGYFENLKNTDGVDHVRCRQAIRRHYASYVVPAPVPRRLSRATVVPPGRTLHLSTGTVIVCPANLVQQWTNEIKKHCRDGSLRVLVMHDNKSELPTAADLLEYDIILFSRPRFDREERDGTDQSGRRAPHGQQLVCTCPYIAQSRTRDCRCFRPDEVYHSPLFQIHFKRILVDEGHYHGTAGQSHAALVADRLVVERRWVVSGTPANGLIGVEVGLAALETRDTSHQPSDDAMNRALRERRLEDAMAQELKDLEKIGNIVTKFLKLRPWVNPRQQDSASWSQYMMPNRTRASRANPYCLRSTLESLIVKHQPADIDIELPPLENRVVYLDPSYYDRLSINVFLLTLTANAVTSEREDEDYLFHPRNRKALNQLINNMRQSGFFWTGFSEADVAGTLEISKTYLEKHRSTCSMDDVQLLEEALQFGETVLADQGWKCFGRYHELGFLVAGFPQEARRQWALDGRDSDPTLFGITQLSLAQNEVDSHLYASDPGAGLAVAGERAMEVAYSSIKVGQKSKESSHKGVPSSALTGDSEKSEGKKKAGTQTPINRRTTFPTIIGYRSPLASPSKTAPPLKSALKQSHPLPSKPGLPSDSPLAKAQMVGAASSKLAYLIDQILQYHRQEKILVAYEGGHIAYYIAQALDVLGVKYLIYASTLDSMRRAQYIVTFNTTETFRVLIMDVRQASHGLNLSSASRVFFINPIWQPNVEAQAVKRAHRIGQTRPVYVETLVLRDTLEDAMLKRRRKMDHDQLQKAQNSLLDDQVMSDIIQNARFLPLHHDEPLAQGKMARLRTPQQLFGRVGRATAMDRDPDEDLVDMIPGDGTPSPRKSVQRDGLDGPKAGLTTNIMAFDSPSRKRATSAMPDGEQTELDRSAPDGTPPTSSDLAQSPPRHARFAMQPEDLEGPTNMVDSSEGSPSVMTPPPKKARVTFDEDDEDEDGDEDGREPRTRAGSASRSLFGGEASPGAKFGAFWISPKPK